MSFLDSVFKRNSELEWMFDLDLVQETSHRAYLKKMALETCINFIGRAISQSDFRILKNGKRQYDDWHYLLNVRPNTDQSAADFWQDFIYKLILDNEVLVVLTDDNDLLIADSFYRQEYAVYPDVFSEVTVKEYTFKRTFQMNEVIHMTYNNEKLTCFMDGMFSDYANLFSRMIETMMLSNQIRGTVNLESTQSLDEKNKSKLQNFIDELYSSFRKNVIALVPKLKGFDYNEVANGSNNGKSIDELTKLKRDLVNDVANILGIPISLVHGEMAEYETAIKAFLKFCVNPLSKKIQDELNAKLMDKKAYLNGTKIEVKGIVEKSVLENSEAVDKLVASGAFTRNEVRELFGQERVDNPVLDEFLVTKNYTSAEGGEKNEGNE